MKIDLTGRTALVTGGSRGIGRGIALALGEAGADTLINYTSNDAAAGEVVELLRRKGVRAKAYKTDVSDPAQADALAQEIKSEFGGVDILVNNAGINRDRSFLKLTEEMWNEVIRVNLGGVFHMCQRFLPGMLEKGWGRVINISSMNGQIGNFGQANYTATKGGIDALTKTLAREVARKGVTVNAVSPGYTETDMTAGIPEKVLEQLKATIPVGRFGQPDEMGAAVVFLACPLAGYLTGQVIGVNGGANMG